MSSSFSVVGFSLLYLGFSSKIQCQPLPFHYITALSGIGSGGQVFLLHNFEHDIPAAVYQGNPNLLSRPR